MPHESICEATLPQHPTSLQNDAALYRENKTTPHHSERFSTSIFRSSVLCTRYFSIALRSNQKNWLSTSSRLCWKKMIDHLISRQICPLIEPLGVVLTILLAQSNLFSILTSHDSSFQQVEICWIACASLGTIVDLFTRFEPIFILSIDKFIDWCIAMLSNF